MKEVRMLILSFLSVCTAIGLASIPSDAWPWISGNFIAYAIRYFLLAQIILVALMVYAYIHARKQHFSENLGLAKRMGGTSKTHPPVSILLVSQHHEKTIRSALISLLNLPYPEYEVVLCNDGSRDKTIDVLIWEFHLARFESFPPQVLKSARIRAVYYSKRFPQLIVIDKEQSGTADSLNAAINFAKHPLICPIDMNCVLDADGLQRLAQAFSEDPEFTVASVAHLATKSSDQSQSLTWSWLSLVRSMENLRILLVGRMGWNQLRCATQINGSIGLFKKAVLVKIGGYARGALGEEQDLLFRMHAHARREHEDWRVHFVSEELCRTEGRSSLRSLASAHSEWQQGFVETLWHNKAQMINPKAGSLGSLALPYLIAFQALAVPFEIISFVMLGVGIAIEGIPPEVAKLFLLVTLLLPMTLNLALVLIHQASFGVRDSEAQLGKKILGALLEPLGYRQIQLIWRLKGMAQWLSSGNSQIRLKAPSKAAPQPKAQDADAA